MELKIQIYSLLFSFLYGILFFFLVNINYKYLYHKKIIIKIIINILFIINNVLIYFIIMKLINNGVLHIYFLFTILGGYLLTKLTCKRFKIFKNID